MEKKEMRMRQMYLCNHLPMFASKVHHRDIFLDARALVADYLECIRLIDEKCFEENGKNKTEVVKTFETLYDAMLEISANL